MSARPAVFQQLFHQFLLRWFYCRFIWRVPTYEPNRWNDNNGIQHNNNCYNYACNLQTNTYAQPGLASGLMLETRYCPGSTQGALADGLRAAAAEAACEGRCHRVALVVAPATIIIGIDWMITECGRIKWVAPQLQT